MSRIPWFLGAVLLSTTFVVVESGKAIGAGDSAPQIASSSRSTFHLRPKQHRVDVVVDLAITNRIPTQAGVRTYIDHWAIIVPNGARKLKIHGPRTALRLAKRGDPVSTYSVHYAPIFVGQTRRLRITFQLPATGPVSRTSTRVTEAYSHFCWLGQPSDTMSVRAVLPEGFESTTRYGETKVRQSDKKVTLTGVLKRGASLFYGCTDSFDGKGMLRDSAQSAGGRSVDVQGWPEHPEWIGATMESVSDSLTLLEYYAGTPLSRDVMIRQVASETLGGYAGEYHHREGIVRVGEGPADPLLLGHELAHTWFNSRTMAETWMIEGHADWLAHTANELWCTRAEPYPGEGMPRLRDWHFLGYDATEHDNALVDYQYRTACNLLEEIDRAAGTEVIRDVNRALLDRLPKYGGTAMPKAPKPDWREWLDAVDEVALVPAGVEDLRMAERLLIEQGIAKPRQLDGRAEARTRYHQAMAGHSVDFMPVLVRDHMDAWDFGKAMKALTIVEEAMAMAAALNDDFDAFGVSETADRLSEARTMQELRAIRRGLVTLSTMAERRGTA